MFYKASDLCWAIACVVLTAIFVLTDSVPAGIPGEWTWHRMAPAGSFLEWIDRFGPALLAGSLLVWLHAQGSRMFPTAAFRVRAAMVAALLLSAAFWVSAVQHAAPLPDRDVKPLWVLYSPASSGYFFEAVFDDLPVSEFLAGYEKRMQQGDVLHVGTHPPGLFLLHRFLVQICRDVPWLKTLTSALGSSDSAVDAFRTLEGASRLSRPLTESELAALQLGAMITLMCGILALIPLMTLANRFWGRRGGWNVACLWIGVPAMAAFLPKSDVMFALTSSLMMLCVVLTLHDRRWICWAMCCGAVLWIGLMCSLAHLVLVFVTAAYVMLRAVQSSGATFRADLMRLSLAAATVVGASLLFWWSTECNIFSVWRLNLVNHAGFYQQYPRTWWKWLLANPVELAFAMGLPATVLVVRGWWRMLRSGAKMDDRQRDGRALCLAVAAAWLLLWLSGKNQGEAARLWIFLMPLLLLGCASVLQDGEQDAKRSSARTTGSVAQSFLIAQLMAAAITVGHISGFDFSSGTEQSAAVELSGMVTVPVARASRQVVLQPDPFPRRRNF